MAIRDQPAEAGEQAVLDAYTPLHIRTLRQHELPRNRNKRRGAEWSGVLTPSAGSAARRYLCPPPWKPPPWKPPPNPAWPKPGWKKPG